MFWKLRYVFWRLAETIFGSRYRPEMTGFPRVYYDVDEDLPEDFRKTVIGTIPYLREVFSDWSCRSLEIGAYLRSVGNKGIYSFYSNGYPSFNMISKKSQFFVFYAACHDQVSDLYPSLGEGGFVEIPSWEWDLIGGLNPLELISALHFCIVYENEVGSTIFQLALDQLRGVKIEELSFPVWSKLRGKVGDIEVEVRGFAEKLVFALTWEGWKSRVEAEVELSATSVLLRPSIAGAVLEHFSHHVKAIEGCLRRGGKRVEIFFRDSGVFLDPSVPLRDLRRMWE